MKEYYTTWGPDRQDCGHRHKKIEQAIACLRTDMRGCRKQGGYSDRQIRVIYSRDDLVNYDVTKGPGHRLDQD